MLGEMLVNVAVKDNMCELPKLRQMLFEWRLMAAESGVVIATLLWLHSKLLT
jgi:hypothetical protein